MITPWSTNAVEITQNMGIEGILRIEAFQKVNSVDAKHDKMLEVVYEGLSQEIFDIDLEPEAILEIDDITALS